MLDSLFGTRRMQWAIMTRKFIGCMSAVRDRQLHIQREYITSQSGKGEMLEDDDAS